MHLYSAWMHAFTVSPLLSPAAAAAKASSCSWSLIAFVKNTAVVADMHKAAMT